MITATVLSTIRRHAMLEANDRVVVAVSGGPDSVALLHVLLELRPELPLSLVVAHLDHALREESRDERAFVEELAARLALPFTGVREDVADLARRERRSLEEAGRLARRRFLRRTAARSGARRVALGHQRDDQAESVLLRLVAGSGRGGLSGIRPVAEGLFVRPLLDCSRQEILAYLDDRKIPFRIDASNADPRFPRNRLRHGVLPLLAEQFNPRVSEAIARTAGILREEDAYLESRARRALKRLRVIAPGSGERGPLLQSPDSRPSARRPSDGEATTCVRHEDREGAAARNRGAGLDPDGHDAAPVVLDAAGLARLAPSIARRVVRLALRRAGLRGRDPARDRIEDVLALAHRHETNVSLSLGRSLTARLEYGRLSIVCDSRPEAERARLGASSSCRQEALAGESRRGEGPENPRTSVSGAGGDGPENLRTSVSRAGGTVPAREAAPFVSSSGERGKSAFPPSVERGVRALPPSGAPSAERDGGTSPAPGARPLEGTASLPGSRPPYPIPLSIPGEIDLPASGVVIRARVASRAEVGADYASAPATRAYVDAAKVITPLQVRPPRPGERFRPLGAPGSRKLSDLWTDLKVPHDLRRRALLVTSADRIVWAVGLRLADPFRVTETTESVLILESVTADAIRASRLSEPEIRSHVEVPDADHEPAARPRPVLYSAEEIAGAVDRLAEEVTTWASGRELTVLGILSGSFVLVADLIRRIPGPLRVGFLDREGNPVPRPLPIEGRTILLVEDILDTGESLSRVLALVRASRPAAVRTCVLFDKPSGRRVPIEADHRGLLVPDRWVVGYGLDVDGRDRNLPYLSYV